MTRSLGSKDSKKRAPGAGRPPGIQESESRAAGAGAPLGVKHAPGGGRPPGIKESKSRAPGAGAPLGVSNHQLPTTKSKKLVDEGQVMRDEGNFKEALKLFEQATVVDPQNGNAFFLVSRGVWKLAYKTNSAISSAEMQRCLSSAEESQRLGFGGAEDFLMFLRVCGPRGRGGILLEHLPSLLSYYEAQTGKELSYLAAALVGITAASVSDTYQLYGVVLSEANQPNLAKDAYLKSVELDPGNFCALHNLSGLFGIDGRLPEAIVFIQATLRLRPALGPSRKLLEKLQVALACSAVAESVVVVDGDMDGDDPVVLVNGDMDPDFHDDEDGFASSSEHHLASRAVARSQVLVDGDIHDDEDCCGTSSEHHDGILGEEPDYQAEVG
jgi:tetratricopeptide (TPR) repeat protein